MNLNFVGIRADKIGKAAAHIVSGCFSEGKTQDIVWRGVSLLENIRDADRKELSFARSWTSNNKEGSIDIIDGSALLIVEFLVSLIKFHIFIIQKISDPFGSLIFDFAINDA